MEIDDTFMIKATLGVQFDFDGVASFVVKAIPLWGEEEVTIVLPYNRCWNEIAYAQNNSIPWQINPYMKPLFSWGPLNLPVPKGSFFDSKEGWAIRIS